MRGRTCVPVTQSSLPYEAIHFHGLDDYRFRLVASGIEGDEVRLVVEYTAKGANSDDVKRRLTRIGIDRSRITTINAASIDLEYGFNADMMGVLNVPVPQ